VVKLKDALKPSSASEGYFRAQPLSEQFDAVSRCHRQQGDEGYSVLSSSCRRGTRQPAIVCELVRGVVFAKEDEVSEGGVRVLRANNTDKDRTELNLDNVMHVSPRLGFSDEKKLKRDDIFVCLASGSKDHIGKVALIREDTDFYFGGFMGAIRVIPGRVLASYLLEQLATGHFNNFLREQIAEANINNLSGGLLYRFRIPLPPLEVQKEIVAEIEGYQRVIDGASAVVDNYRSHITLDPDWPVVELSRIIETKPRNGYSGKPVDRVTNVKVLTLTATTSGTLDVSKFKYLDENIPLDASCRCRKGDTYLQRGNTAELVGTAALFDVDEPNFIYPDLMIRVRADENKVTSRYLLIALQDNSVREYLTRNAVGAAGSMPKINQGIVEHVPIPLPPIATQQTIVAEIEAEKALVAANRELIARFDRRIQATLARVWGEEEAASTKARANGTAPKQRASESTLTLGQVIVDGKELK
jgi:restriction endonuclease S subunit